MNRRQSIILLSVSAGVLIGVPTVWTLLTSVSFPSDHTPNGAYLRIAISIGKGNLSGCLPYLETEAQDAVYTIREYRAKALVVVKNTFREPERSRWLAEHRREAEAKSPERTWEAIAQANGWEKRLRRDLSGIARVERQGDRATVQTLQGTRYTFRRAKNGIWGLTMFTADLLALKQRAARDWKVIQRSAAKTEKPSSLIHDGDTEVRDDASHPGTK